MSDTGQHLSHGHHENLNFKAPDISIPEIFDATFAPIGKRGWRQRSSDRILNSSYFSCPYYVHPSGLLRLWVTGLHLPTYWGGYIITFVFWIGVAHAGALISALLRLCGSEWKSAVTRVAEVITLFTLPAAASFPLIHIGRTELAYYCLPLPNARLLWPNFKSMLIWDVFAISTYLTGSVIFLYVTTIPDLGIARPV